MRCTHAWLLSLALLVAVAACSGHDVNASADGSTATGGPGASTAATALPSSASTGYVLTTDKVNAYYTTILRISAGSMGRAPGERDPATDALVGDGPAVESGVAERAVLDSIAIKSSETLDQYIARVDADPKARALITSGGMSVDDYARTSQALGEARMVAGALDSGALKEIPDGVDPQHVEFFKQHKANIDAMTQALEQGFGG